MQTSNYVKTAKYKKQQFLYIDTNIYIYLIKLNI